MYDGDLRLHHGKDVPMSISVNAASQLYHDALRQHFRRASVLYLLQAGLMVVSGLIAIAFPVIASEALIVLLGWMFIVTGVIQGMGLLSSRHSPHGGLQAISAVLGLLIGFLILRNPIPSLVTLSLLVVIFCMIDGVAKVVWSLAIRPLQGWAWITLSGVVGIALSILLLSRLESTATWLLALLVGVQLVSAGLALGYVAWFARGIPKG